MSLGQDLAAGIRAGQSLFEPLLERKRQEQQLQQQLKMQQLRDAAELQQKQAERNLIKQDNLQANKAALALLQSQGLQLPEAVSDEQLQALSPQQLNAAADDWSRRSKEKGDLERKQKGAFALWKALPENLRQSITAEDVVNLDPALLNSLMNQDLNRTQRDTSREDNQAFRQSILGQQFENQKALKGIAFENQKAMKYLADKLSDGNRESGGSGGGKGRSGGKVLKRYNPDTDSYDLYDATTGQKLGGQKPQGQSQKDLYAPINIPYISRRG